MRRPKIKSEFYRRTNVVAVARDLLGKVIVTNFNGQLTSAIITETEAYSGHLDKACHAYLSRHTERTRIFFEEGGYSYVYMVYGIHFMFNIITNTKGNPDAVLIRSAEPLEGIDIMQSRRKLTNLRHLLTGPGKFTQAMGLTKMHNGMDLYESDEVWMEEYKTIPDDEIFTSTRIGIDYAEEDALLPWRFYITGSDYISKR